MSRDTGYALGRGSRSSTNDGGAGSSPRLDLDHHLIRESRIDRTRIKILPCVEGDRLGTGLVLDRLEGLPGMPAAMAQMTK